MANLTKHLYEQEEVVAALKWSIVNGRVMETAFWCQELLESGGPVLEALIECWIWHFGIGCLGIGKQLLGTGPRFLEHVSEPIHAAQANFGIPNHSRGLIPKFCLEIAVTMARMRQWRDASVLALFAAGYKVTTEPDRVAEWDLETATASPRQRSFHRALKQRKALLAWCYARTAWPAAWDWMDKTWLASTSIPVWQARALAVAAAALTKKERDESEATTWKLLPTEIENALMDWDTLIGRARRVYSIPTDCLFWITSRGRVPYTTTNIVTLTSQLEVAMETSPYWQRHLPPEWGMREEAYDAFYDVHFPTDIPDEWSRADREKSHGGGVLGIKEVPIYEKYLRRWFSTATSRVLWGGVAAVLEGYAVEPCWDDMYDSAQAEWRTKDATWKLTPAKKVLILNSQTTLAV